MTPNKVNLYIDGSDFYRGSTRKDLKNGWCDFRVLGRILAKRHFGSSFDVGKIWYVTNADAPEIRYGQQRRKALWLDALRAEVEPEIAYHPKQQASVALGLEAVADTAGSRLDERAPYTIVISADPASLSPMQGVITQNDGEVVLAIPPDLSVDSDGASSGLEVSMIRPFELEGSHLDDTVASKAGQLYTWSDYARSKEESKVVVGYCQEVWEALGDTVERELRKSQMHDSIVPGAIRSRLAAQVERFLWSGQRFDKQLSMACRSFITQDIIDRALRARSSPDHGSYEFLPISNGEQGRTYKSLFGNYLADARSIQIRDPYVRHGHQVSNVEDLLAIVREPRGCRVRLVTMFDRKNKWPPAGEAIVRARLDELRNRLLRRGFIFSYRFDPDLHDRRIDTENWRISLGRGLDMYYRQQPGQPPQRAMSCNIIYMTKHETKGRTPAMPPQVGQSQQDVPPSVRAVLGSS